ncbi:hypothetical protein C9I50_04000 [Pseudomonas prosekii]|uniref:hypothetical protein n=1 Tax=Pseudomonas prosekii TaxID=1148509 RepID=UPI000D60CB65|nr:hypothetical protein [Pseudomonas prosekii]PWE45143.1 hypothetical protein C9I50_04000 [Pseudomonas prosekii]
MDTNINGKISFNTDHRVPFESTDLFIHTLFDPQDYSLTFYVNQGQPYSERHVSFSLLGNIASGTYPLQQGSAFSSAGYTEHTYDGTKRRPNQYTITSGALRIKVTGAGTPKRTYEVEEFTIVAESGLGTATRELKGNFTFYIEGMN